MAASDERYVFIAEWYDNVAEMVKKFILYYFLRDSSVEMIEYKKNRLFLKRTIMEHLSPDDFYLNSSVSILNRMIKIVEFADEYTKLQLKKREERTLAFVKHDALHKIGQILEDLQNAGLYVCRMKMLKMSRAAACDLYKHYSGQTYYETLVRYLTDQPSIVLELRGENAVFKLLDLSGPEDPVKARQNAPNSLRAKYGTDLLQNAIHCATSAPSAASETELLFPSFGPPLPNTATYNNCTCCIIKPHAIKEGLHPKIILTILETGFHITAIQTFYFDEVSSEEFFQVYRGVIAEYPAMISQMTSGFCIAMELTSSDSKTAQCFRELVGPADPEIACILRPFTLRAKFGKDKILNAVHCTDLPEDAVLETEYFFKILDQ